MFKNLKLYLRVLIFSLIWIVIFSLFWNYFFLSDLFSHFYGQYFVVTIILLICFIFSRDKTWIFTSGFVLIFLWFFVLQTSYPINSPKIKDKFYFINAYFWNEDSDKIINDIKKLQPKYLAIVELNKKLYENIKTKLNYKYEFYYDLNVYSFWFFTNEEIIQKKVIEEKNYPIWFVKLKKFDLFIIHPFPPFNNDLYQKQKQFFAFLGKILENKTNFLLVWDFNSSYYSPLFRKYFWSYYFHPVYSWNIYSPLTIPIDYAISDKKLKVYPWNKLSSDHIPLIIDPEIDYISYK